MEAAEILRIEGDPANKGNILDENTKNAPAFWRGNDVEVQIALVVGKTHLVSTDVTEITVEVKDELAHREDPSIFRASSTNFDGAHTAATWEAGTTALTKIQIGKDITARLIPKRYWLIIKAKSATKEAVYFAQLVEVKDPRSGSVSSYDFSAGGIVQSGDPTNQLVSTPILGGAMQVVVNVPAGFVATDLSSYYVDGPAGVELGDSIVLGGAIITFPITAPAAADGTHTLEANFTKYE